MARDDRIVVLKLALRMLEKAKDSVANAIERLEEGSYDSAKEYWKDAVKEVDVAKKLIEAAWLVW